MLSDDDYPLAHKASVSIGSSEPPRPRLQSVFAEKDRL